MYFFFSLNQKANTDNSLKLDYPPMLNNSDYLIDLHTMPISQNFDLKIEGY